LKQPDENSQWVVLRLILKEMIRIFYHKNDAIEKAEGSDILNQISIKHVLWVDLQFPTIEEQNEIEKKFEINFDLQEEESGLESNARFYETDQFIYIHSNFTSKQAHYYENCPIIFYVLDGILVTKRNIDLSSFAETVKKIKRNQKAFKNGSEILEGILETEVDLDSDYLEYISKEIAQLGKNLSKDNPDEESVLLKINKYQESTLFLREGFVDKQRVVSSLIKSHSFTSTPRLRILVKDINSMLEFSAFIFKRLEYLQNMLMGLITIEQNKAIKIFTIVSVVFMPPTLIASVYGMNFKLIPELSWDFGYPMALFFIISSSLLTLFIFKRKKWL